MSHNVIFQSLISYLRWSLHIAIRIPFGSSLLYLLSVCYDFSYDTKPTKMLVPNQHLRLSIYN